MRFNIPSTITSGDRVVWQETVAGAIAGTDLVSCFVRGINGSADITGVPIEDKWQFEITEAVSTALGQGKYFAQFALFGAGGKKTLGVANLEVLPNLAAIDNFDPRTEEEKELEQLNEAIAKLSSGVAEYYIGERRVRYTELPVLYERQRYLRNRIVKLKSKYIGNGRNVPIRFMQ